MQKCLIAVLMLAFLAGCPPRRIPGTEIDDTNDTREILGVMEQYRQAMEARDANAVMKLAADTFKDDAGTGTVADDLDYKGLREELPRRLSRVSELKLELTVKRIDIREDGYATAIYNYSTTFRIPSLTNKVQSESGIKELALKLVNDKWMLQSGL